GRTREGSRPRGPATSRPAAPRGREDAKPPGDGAVRMLYPRTWSREESHMRSQRPSKRPPPLRAWRALSVPLLILLTMGPAAAFEVVLSTQGEYMDGYLVNGKAFPPRVIVNDPDPHPPDSLSLPPYLGGRQLTRKA